MKSTFIFFSCLLLLCAGCSDRFLGLEPDIEGLENTFLKIYGGSYDQTGVAVMTLDDGFLLLGNTFSESSGQESQIYLVETDFEGITRKIQVISTNEEAYEGRATSMIQTEDGGFLICGTSTRIVNPTAAWDSTDIWLVKLDGGLQVEWNEIIAPVPENEFGAAVQQGPDGSLYVLGTTAAIDENKSQQDPFQPDSTDLLLVKLDANNPGQILWRKTYGYSGVDKAKDLMVLDNGDLIILGSTDYPESNTPNLEVLLIMVNEYGNAFNTQTVGSLDSGVDYIPASLSLSADRSFFGITGAYREFGTDQTLFLTVDRNFQVLLSPQALPFTFGPPDNPFLAEISRGIDIKAVPNDDNAFIISGTVLTSDLLDIMLIEVSEQGGIVAEKSIGNEADETGGSFDFTDDGVVVIGTSIFLENTVMVLTRTNTSLEAL
ncbi:MAG: hypothetical protein AAFR61_14170 [Bacteroidota bacterium]